MYYAHVKRLHSVKWRGLYGDTATMQELLKTCTSSAWKKRNLKWNCHWIVYGTGLQHSLALADLPLGKLWKRSRRHMTSSSLGPVVKILAIFSYANFLKNKRTKRCHIKGIGCPLVISINIDIFDQETEKSKKRRKNDQTGKQARRAAPPSSTSKVSLDDFDQGVVQWTIASMYTL